MAKNFKTTHEIGCALRNFKNFGYGEAPILKSKNRSFIVPAKLRNVGIAYIRVNLTNRQNLSWIDGDFN